MLRPCRSLVVVLALAVTACNPAEKPDYGWDRTPASQLRAVAGLVLGVGQAGRTSAKISLVCTPSRRMHLVIRGVFPDRQFFELPRRDVVEVHIGPFTGHDVNAARTGVTTILDGRVLSSVSDELSDAVLNRIALELAENPDGRVVAFGIRETLLYFDLKVSPGALKRFVSECQARA